MSTTAAQYPHLAMDARGRAIVAGTRYKIIHLAGEHYHYGWSAEELLEQHPDLRPEQVYAALTYFYDHRDAMIREMHAAGPAIDELAGRRPSRRIARAVGWAANAVSLALYMDVHIPRAITRSPR
ncbi:DUF433 domain-containing protein [Paludisphaera sp.]|uniref:DUF433 domain-containing protein n=1 Tax=Paludisphaera sp. TaxID=2017432 RepID=UPI00301BD821